MKKDISCPNRSGLQVFTAFQEPKVAKDVDQVQIGETEPANKEITISPYFDRNTAGFSTVWEAQKLDQRDCKSPLL